MFIFQKKIVSYCTILFAVYIKKSNKMIKTWIQCTLFSCFIKEGVLILFKLQNKLEKINLNIKKWQVWFMEKMFVIICQFKRQCILPY